MSSAVPGKRWPHFPPEGRKWMRSCRRKVGVVEKLGEPLSWFERSCVRDLSSHARLSPCEKRKLPRGARPRRCGKKTSERWEEGSELCGRKLGGTFNKKNRELGVKRVFPLGRTLALLSRKFSQKSWRSALRRCKHRVLLTKPLKWGASV